MKVAEFKNNEFSSFPKISKFMETGHVDHVQHLKLICELIWMEGTKSATSLLLSAVLLLKTFFFS